MSGKPLPKDSPQGNPLDDASVAKVIIHYGALDKDMAVVIYLKYKIEN